MSDEDELFQIIEGIGLRRKFHKLDYYQPYDYQKDFHHAEGYKTPGRLARQRALMAANKVGKTLCGGAEAAMHLTGQYIEGWEGWRFPNPIVALCGSNTNEQTRDIVQAELFGDPTDDKLLGTGSIPIDCIGEKTRKPGVPNAFDSVMVRHVSGGFSKVMFRAYEQGAKKHMGSRIDLGWLDEEPPHDIWAQYLRGTFSTSGIIMMTFTPEEGVTEVVNNFLNDLKTGQALVRAGWDDAPHMTEEVKAEFFEQISPHERKMRMQGIPMMGSGLIFPVKDEAIMCDPIEIPAYWPRICAIDYGYDHPFAAVWIAIDRDNDTFYIYDAYKESKQLLSAQAQTVKRHGDWIPVVWPHDVNKTDTKSGRPYADIFRDDYGLNMLPMCFSNPPALGQKEGQGGQGREVGLMAMLEAMEEGRFKVFSTCQDWFKEKNIYHRKMVNGKSIIVDVNEDIMSASRYAFQSQRFADIKPVMLRRQATQTGLRNW